MAMPPLGTITVLGEQVLILPTTYKTGRLALELYGPGNEPWGLLTVNIPQAHLDEGEILVKTWEENAPLREPALASGLFEDTGRRVPIGFVEAEVWRLALNS